MPRLWLLLAGLELCFADWTVASGACRVDSDGCLQSPRYPSSYRNSQNCEVTVADGNSKSINVKAFDTETGYDILEVNGRQYSGTAGPNDVVPSGTITWSSDYSITAGGWRLCLQDLCVGNEKITGNGEDYRGCQTRTRSGKTCQRWDADNPHNVGIYRPSVYSSLADNYCRNPGGSGETIWCFTTDPDVKWEYCDHLPLWTIEEGSCSTDLACSRSPGYPENYGTNQVCTLKVGSGAQGGVLQVNHFETELNYDLLSVDGSAYSGNAGPPAQEVTSEMQITWVSDHSITKSGWEICIVFPESDPTSTSATQTSSTSTSFTTSMTTRTITFSTTLVSNISLRGQLFLGVSDPSAAEATFETETGSQALRQGIADPFDDIQPDSVELLGVMVVTAARRLSSAGQVLVDYIVTVAVGAALDHSLLSSSSTALTQSINQALTNANIAITISSAQHVELTTTTSRTETLTQTSSTTRSATTTSATRTITTTRVNCQFSDWSCWGKCNRPCNGGNQTRTRSVAVPEVNGGTPCVGDEEEMLECNAQTCAQCVPGYHLVFVSNEEVSCIPCERGRYNPVASSDSSGACRLCERGEESFGGATECTPCSLGSAATQQLNPTVSATAASQVQSFGAVDATSMELQCDCTGSLSFQAACATARSVNFTVEVWLASSESVLLELQLGSGAPVGWNFNVAQGLWQTTSASPQLSFPQGESLVRLWTSTQGLRIRSLTMQYPSSPSNMECGFVPSEEIWTCSRCAPGEFADSVGMTECKQCAAGSYSSESGSSVCEACKPGSFGNRSGAGDFGVCQDCPMGFFGNFSGMSECEPCAAGSFSNQSGVSSSDECLQCLPGTASDPGSAFCSDCEAGRFAGVGAAGCSACPAGEVAMSPGSSACVPCNAGTYAENGTVCTPCPSGSYSTAMAAAGLEMCQACPAGTFSEMPGADNQTKCLDCSAGSFSTAGSSACELCSSGQISGFAATSCQQCALGSFAGSPGMSACELCLAGTYGHNDTSSCLQCGAGSYSQALGATGPETCVACAAGTASQATGASSPLTCEPCLPGLAADAGSAECSVCVAGTYSTPQQVCEPCPLGQFVEYFGQTECFECWPGTFNDDASTPTVECQACPVGSFLNFRGGTAMADCQACPAGTSGGSQGMPECEECPAGSVSRTDGNSRCEACPAMSDTPAGAVACCPSENLEKWGSSTGSLSLAPGKSKSEVYYISTPGSCDSATVEASSLVQDGQVFPGEVKLVTMGQDSIHSCLELACNEEDKAHCSLRVILGGRENFGTGETLKVQALIETKDGTQVCTTTTDIVFEGFGCAPNTLQFFLLALSVVVSGTVLLGLTFELIGNCRLLILVECTFSIKLPKMWASRSPLKHSSSELERIEIKAAPAIPVAGSSPQRRLSERESELVVAEEVRLPGMESLGFSDEEDAVKIGWKDSADPEDMADDAAGPVFVPRAKSSHLDHADVLLEPGERKILRSASHGAVDKGDDEEEESRSSFAWPSQVALKQSVSQLLKIEPRRFVHFAAWAVKFEDAPMLQVEYAVRVPKGQHLELRQQLSRCKWRLAPNLPAPWDQATVQQQPPAFIKAQARAPGMDLLDFVEKLATKLTRTKKEEEDAQQLQQLHLEVARHLLRRLTSRNARIFLGIQYFCNLCAAAFLPFAGYQMMTSCDEGFPTYIHGAWFLYMCITNLMSFALLRTVSGQHAAAFCYRFRWRLLFRAVCSFILLTDTYQDATFPVIANKCNFELWFVSAWLVGLGVGLMQVLVQLLVIASCAKKYQNATTPEERDRLLVQGAFIALRGSDNLVLVYAVRPAVEERLGGSSSWAMKLSEARIALLRFIFEDVEQSALQAVFLIFYDEAAIGDKLWVTTSILTSLLLSFTIVVQCMPEVRDWLWHRVFASFPGGRMIPPLRVFWFILVVLIYRCLSAFPWISACSPTGDPCQSREWWEFYWSCANGRTTLLGLEARIKVVDETISNSTIGVAIILSAVALATVVWWTRKKCLSIYQRMKLDSLESYNFSKRMQPQQGQPLRPLLDADDDLWLDAARQLYPVLSRAQVHKQKAMAVALETIDRNTFTVSRAHLGGWSLPGVHWYLCRQIPKKLNKFVQTANSLALPQESMTNVYLFRTTVSHAVRVAKVRRHVQQLLSNRRHFIKASLERKALWILECPDTPPVRLLHWSEIAKAGALPKYQNGGAAKPVEQLLEDVAERLSVPRESVEQRLVVFLLSHRWLRTESDYHPDSEDNVKANKLVSFARWFMRLADAAGVPCEVAFWIDYCCCEQEDRFGMELAMAALPLYIACCTKVVVWRTPDFDRRCWTMVERLLSYSFCSGGLTPYVIDSSFVDEDEEEEEDEEDEASHPDDSPSIWEVRLDDESWVPFDDFAQAILRSAKAAGLPRSEVMSVGRRYEVDFKHMCQKSKESGKQRQIRERSLKPGAEGKTWKEAKPALVSERQKPGRASQSTINSIQDRIHRVAKKLPNPLDPETCLLSRESHRRHISSLVSVAMQVPAFEVFADRQPVEWGLTEVIEHSLVSQEPLPKEGVTSDLLELSAGRVGPNAPTTSWWKLVVLEPGKRTRHVDPLSDMDVIVWMDYGSVPSTPPPSPEQLEMLFADVDLAIDQGTKMEREECIKELILALKADLTAAVNSNDEAQMEAAVVRAREVELQAKTSAVSCLVTNRLLAAAESGSEAEMRNALRFAREKGMEKLQVYKEVLALQQGLYGKQLLPRLERLVSEDADFAELGAVHHTAETHGLVELARRVLALGESRLKQAALLDTEDALQKTLQVRDEAKACGWSAVEQLAEVQVLRLTMELALARAEHSDDMATLRAVEMRAQQENFTELAERAARKVNETARKVGQKMGLPAGWDVVERMAGTDAARLLKKDEETGQALLKRVQELVDATFWGWGGHGAKTRTRDRGSEPVAKKLKVVSVIYVQNAEVYVNYRARREEISASITAEMATGDAWDVKTAAVPLLGGRLKENPVDPSMNEHYLWHGCKPEGAEGITDANFDLKRAGSAYGSLFGPGIYLAESCMKADEYTSPDARGYFPLLLCRATLGNINYCDHPSPVSISPSLVASCKAGGGYHSVLGDREKINGTFREFIVFDNHQVYPEYIVWYQRQF